MNRGLKSYGILLVMITTLVFTLDFGVVNATTSADQNPSTQSSGLPDLNHDSGDKNQCDDCNSNGNNNNNNNNDDDDDDNNKNNNDLEDGSISSSSSNANNKNNNDLEDGSISSSSSSNNDGEENINSGDVPMSLPFDSHVGEESDDNEKDYSSIIPFP